MRDALAMPIVAGLTFLTLMQLLGLVIAGRLVDRAGLAGAAAEPVVRGWLLRLPALLAWFLLMLALVRGALQVLAFHDPGTPLDTELMRIVLTEGSWGTGWMLETAGAFVLLALSWLLAARPAQQRTAITILVIVIVLAEAGMGHGADALWTPAPLGRLVHATHLLGAGVWLGTLLVMALAVFPALVATEARAVLAGVLTGFSPWARLGAALLVVSGGAATWTYTGSLLELPQVPWGQLLLAKLLVLLPILGLGWYNWRVLTPRLVADDAPAMRTLRRAALVEVLLAVAVIAITAAMVHQALPVDG